MRKLYTLISMLFVVVAINAATYDIPEENEVLQGEAYNMELYRNINFVDWTINGNMIDENQWLSIGSTVSDVPTMNGYQPVAVTTPGLSNMLLQFEGAVSYASGYGLRNTNSGPRWFGLSGMKAGQILVVQTTTGGYTYNQEPSTVTDGVQDYFIINAYKYNVSDDWAMHFYDEYDMDMQLEDISAEVHAAQDVAAGVTDPEATVADGFRYYRVLNDGLVYFAVGRSASLQGIQIWLDASAGEVITTPSYKMTKVDGSTRFLTLTSGESSKGFNVTTYYSFEKNPPIYLEETDEVESEEIVYTYDDEGNVIDEQVVVTYKKVLVDKDGFYGDNEYFEGDEISFDENEDEDGDGYVTVNIATVSEKGNYSDILSFDIQVNAITLNTPTLALVGFDGLQRTYQIGWDNNTLCGEEYEFVVVADGDTYTDLTIGDNVSATNTIEVTVKVAGYEDGVLEPMPVDAQGTELTMVAGIGNGQSESHNWDFQNLSEETLEKINGTLDHYAVYDDDGNVLRTYTLEQEANEEIPEEDLSVMEEVRKTWGWDGADSRNAARHWRTWIPTYELDEEGNPTTTIESSAYAEEEAGIFGTATADNTHASYSTMAIFTDGSGLYTMNRATVTIQATYGQYVVYTTNTGTTVGTVENADGTYEVGFPGGVYLYYIDVFTYDGLPEPDAINSIAAERVNNGIIYTMDGRIAARNAETGALNKGIYILNGKKFIVR